VFDSSADGLAWVQSQNEVRRAKHDLDWLKGAVRVKAEQNERQKNVLWRAYVLHRARASPGMLCVCTARADRYACTAQEDRAHHESMLAAAVLEKSDKLVAAEASNANEVAALQSKIALAEVPALPFACSRAPTRAVSLTGACDFTQQAAEDLAAQVVRLRRDDGERTAAVKKEQNARRDAQRRGEHLAAKVKKLVRHRTRSPHRAQITACADRSMHKQQYPQRAPCTHHSIRRSQHA